MRNIIVYTAFTKGYDTLKEPPAHWLDEADFVAFIEHSQPNTSWQIRQITEEFTDPCRNAKRYKILPHIYFPQAEYSIWIDGSVELIASIGPRQLIATYLAQHDLAVFRHRRRQCVYAEGRMLIATAKDSPKIIRQQMHKYMAEGYPRRNGLVECGVLVRRHSPKVQQFNETWQAQILAYSRRDQLSFPYAAHAVGLKFEIMPDTIWNNDYFKVHQHAQEPLPQKIINRKGAILCPRNS